MPAVAREAAEAAGGASSGCGQGAGADHGGREAHAHCAGPPGGHRSGAASYQPPCNACCMHVVWQGSSHGWAGQAGARAIKPGQRARSLCRRPNLGTGQKWTSSLSSSQQRKSVLLTPVCDLACGSPCRHKGLSGTPRRRLPCCPCRPCLHL